MTDTGGEELGACGTASPEETSREESDRSGAASPDTGKGVPTLKVDGMVQRYRMKGAQAMQVHCGPSRASIKH